MSPRPKIVGDGNFGEWRGEAIQILRTMQSLIVKLADKLGEQGAVQPAPLEDPRPLPSRIVPKTPAAAKVHRGLSPLMAAAELPPPPSHTTPLPDDDEDGGAQAKHLLIAAAWRNGKESTAVELALLCGYSPNSGGVTRGLASLRRRGLLDGCSITPDGSREAAETVPFPRRPTARELQEQWIAWLPAQHAGLFRECLRAHPRALTVHEAADAAGYSLASGGVTRAAAKLRRMGIVAKRGKLVLHPIFFEGTHPQSNDTERG